MKEDKNKIGFSRAKMLVLGAIIKMTLLKHKLTTLENGQKLHA